MSRGHDDAVDITLRSYELAAQRYADRTGGPGPASCAFLDRLALAVGPGRHVLEIGSGTGMDATYLALLTPAMTPVAVLLPDYAAKAATGSFRLPIGHLFTLDDWYSAAQLSLSGRPHGKVVLIP